jgi:hypothetical protein
MNWDSSVPSWLCRTRRSGGLMEALYLVNDQNTVPSLATYSYTLGSTFDTIYSIHAGANTPGAGSGRSPRRMRGRFSFRNTHSS